VELGLRVLVNAGDPHIYAQIGEWLGIKENTARVRYLRAKKKLGVMNDQLGAGEDSIDDRVLEKRGTHE
jgi:hypothetical protein